MKLLALCNDRMALPALSQLLQTGMLSGVGMTSRQSETHAVVKMLCANQKVPYRVFGKSDFSDGLEQWVTELQPDAVLVKTFPWKIPARVLDIPRYGFINFHYAPLPEYRGPNPLFWMLKDGVKEAGVTVHRMTAEFDDGPVLFRSSMPIHPQLTFGMLCSQLGFSGVDLTAKVLQGLQSGRLDENGQGNAPAGWYGRPKPQDLWVNWNSMNAEAVRRLVNACNPWNKGAPGNLNGWTLGFTYVTPVSAGETSGVAPGTILTLDEANGLCIACADNTVLRADVLYMEEGFVPGFALAGFGIRPGMVFTSVTI